MPAFWSRPGLIVLLPLIAACLAAQPSWADQPAAIESGSERAFYAANGLLQRGLFDLAAKEYTTFLEADPDHPNAAVARYGLGVSLYRLGQWAGAAEQLALLPDGGHPYAMEAATLRGECLIRTGELNQGAEILRSAIRQNPDHELADEAALSAADALYRLGEWQQAVEVGRWIESHVARGPVRDRGGFVLGAALFNSGAYPEAIEVLEGLIRRSPADEISERAMLLLAQSHHQDGSHEQASSWYRKVVESGTKELLPDALLGWGTTLASTGDEAGAAAALDRLLTDHPESAAAIPAAFHRGRIFFDEQQYALARPLFERVAAAEGDLADAAAYWSAKCVLRLGDPADAASRFASIIERFPSTELRPDIEYDRAVALARSGETEAAAAVARRMLETSSDQSHSARTQLLLASLELQLGNHDQAIEHAGELAVANGPSADAGEAQRVLAEAYFRAGRFQEAAERYADVLDSASSLPGIRCRLGQSLYRIDRLDDAIPHLQACTESAGEPLETAAAFFALGDVWFRRGEWKKVVEAMTAALRAQPGATWADDALLKIGLSWQRQNQFERALAVYDDFLGRNSPSQHLEHVRFERGQCLLALQRWSDAQAAFEQVIAGDDGRFHPLARRHLGAIAMRQGRYEDAARYLESASAPDSSTDADPVNTAFLHGQALLARGDASAALAIFDGLLEKADPGLAPQLHARRALTLARLERCEAAITAIDGLEQRHADQLDAQTRTALLYEKAWCHQRQGEDESALGTYLRLVKQDPTGPYAAHALLNAATISMDAARFAQAADLLQELERRAVGGIALPPGVAEQLAYRLAVCAFRLEQWDAAAHRYTSFLDQFPEAELAPSAAYFGGEALFHTGRFSQAADLLERSLDSGSTSSDFAEAALLRLGQCLAEQQKWSRSEEVFSRHLSRFADSSQWYQSQFGVAWARENQQRYPEAIQAYRRVTEGHQGVTAARAQFQIGECLFAMKRFEEAAAELLKADILYAYPEWSAAALYEAGRCFEQLNQNMQAREQFQAVRDRFPDTKWAQLSADRLGQIARTDLPGR